MMGTWVLVFVFVLATFWHARLRKRSKYDRRPPYSVATAITEDIREVDYVVVGGGPGGLAACQRLLASAAHSTQTPSSPCRVLLIEAGQDPLAATSVQELWQSTVSKQRLLCFAPECVTPQDLITPTLTALQPVDQCCLVRRPFRPASDIGATVPPETPHDDADAEKARQREARERQLMYTAYPRGCGVGGGALLDWGLKIAAPVTVQTTCAFSLDEPPRAAEVVENPLSWGFRDAALALKARSDEVAETEPWALGSVFRADLRVDPNGRRLPLSSAVLGTLPRRSLQRLTILTGFTVSYLATTKNGDASPADCDVSVREVIVRRSRASSEASALEAIRVRCGVVLCAGAVHSPRILYETFQHSALARHRKLCDTLIQQSLTRGLTSPTVELHDGLALPFITKTHMRISTDRVNMCDAKHSVMYWFAQRGAFLSPFTDSVASIPMPSLGPQAQLLVFLLPLGGRDVALYDRLGWDRILGSFHEAVTMLLVLTGVPELRFGLSLQRASEGDKVAASLPSSHKPPRCVSAHQPVVLSKDLTHRLHEAFRTGIHLCRELVVTAPLSYLSPGTEAVDVTLLKDDPAKAFKLAQLTHTPAKHLTAKKKRELAELCAWSMGVSKSEAYEKAYIDQHAYWLGFGHGSSAVFVNKKRCVDGISNLRVGDTSGEVGATLGSLYAGSVDAALNAGAEAAETLAECLCSTS